MARACTCIVVRARGADAPMEDARRVVPRGDGGGGRRVPGRPLDAEHPLLHPLHERLDGQAEGDPAHHRRLPDAGRLDAQARLRPQARARTSTGARPTSAGSPGTLHRLRAAAQRRDVGDVRGRARLPAQGHLVGAVRALRRDDLLHGADGDPGVHEVGRRARRPSTTCRKLRLLGTVGEPINPKAWLWYWKVVGGGALPDRRHVVADRDRRDHDHDAAGRPAREAGLGRHAAAGDRGGRAGRGRATRSTHGTQGLLALRRPWPSMLRTLYSEDERFVETYFDKWGRDTYLVGDAAAATTRTATSGSSGASTTCINVSGPPHVDRRDRVGDRLAPQGRRGGGDRAGRRGHRPGRSRRS